MVRFRLEIVVVWVFLMWCSPILLIAQVNPCTQDTSFHIVVLGSSTAAGAGASPSDSSWVNRYRAHLQSINSGNQVTNLAVGGFNTYRIMPTGFQPPANRPAVDTNQNITAGLALNPDAIIVNLPSNDVSSGFTVGEQLDNFDTLWNEAQVAGVPIWICTTQPKNYSNPAKIQAQVDVRDSIWARYNPFVLDFWSGIADSTNQIDPFYDSGDGTHLNNSGHYLLFNRAADEDIPGMLYQPPAYTDYTPLRQRADFEPVCGDSLSTFVVYILNRGLIDPSSITTSLQVTHLATAQTNQLNGNLNGNLATCTEDSILYTVNTALGGTYEFIATVSSPADLRSDNDTLRWTANFLGHPQIQVMADTGCGNASLLLLANGQPGDSIRWYDAATAGNLIGTGPALPITNINATTTYYAQASRGDFFFRNSLTTTTNSNINWNGAMFDLVADSNLVIDSIGLKVTTAGSQMVEVYTRMGSHLGFETNAAAWSFQGAYPVQVTNTAQLSRVGGLSLGMAVGDTMGVYLQLQNLNSDLGYQSQSNPQVRSNDELQILTGSGASHNFGGNYYPRDWNGRVYYHFGTRPDGDCQGPLVPVQAFISEPQVSLGNDTILDDNDLITLDAGGGFIQYLWSDGSTGQTLNLDGNVLGTGVYTIIVQVTDSLGCMANDTIIVVFAPLVGQDAGFLTSFRMWPNPGTEWVATQCPQDVESIEIWSLMGERLRSQAVSPGTESKLNVSSLASGTYLVKPVGGSALPQLLRVYH